MILSYDPRTDTITPWEIPEDGILKVWLPYACKADCCDIACNHAEDDPACEHTDHTEKGQCVVKVSLDTEGLPVYECLGVIPRGSHVSDCRHIDVASCDCGVRDKYEAKIAQKHGPVRTVGRQKNRQQAEMAAIVQEGVQKVLPQRAARESLLGMRAEQPRPSTEEEHTE